MFVLSVEIPGFDVEDIDVNWHEGRLDISAEPEDDARRRRLTYLRTFRMPKEIEPDDVEAEYTNGVLEAHLPIIDGAGQPRHRHRGRRLRAIDSTFSTALTNR